MILGRPNECDTHPISRFFHCGRTAPVLPPRDYFFRYWNVTHFRRSNSRSDESLMRDPAKRRLWILVAALSLIVAATTFQDWWLHVRH
jgi:hypothetical protein